MNFNEEIKCDGGLYEYFYDWIVKEFETILHQHEEIYDILKKDGIGLGVGTITVSECISDQLLKGKRGHLRRDTVGKSLRNWKDKELHSPMCIFDQWKLVDDKLYIYKITLQIRIPGLCYDICRNISHLELFRKELAWTLRHEFGHIIDHLHTMHGITVEEFEERIARENKAYEEYYDTIAKITWDTREKVDEQNRMYYRIPHEMEANNLIGIDVNDLIKLMHEIDDEYGDKKTRLNISHDTLIEIPPEDKNEDAE